MTMIISKLCAAAVAAIVAVGFTGIAAAQGTAPAASPAPAAAAPGADQTAAGPAGAARPLEVPLLYVTGVEVLSTANDPKTQIVKISALASSPGWTNPQIVPFFFGKSADDVLDLQIIATSPEQSQKAEGFVPISAIFVLEPGNSFKGVRVRAAANALELKQIPGSATAQIKAEDCKDCIGKKFVEKGQAAGAPGIIRGEDLPHGYRAIAPTHGVAGEIHSPNRLNLILDASDKIVMVFWE